MRDLYCGHTQGVSWAHRWLRGTSALALVALLVPLSGLHAAFAADAAVSTEQDATTSDSGDQDTDTSGENVLLPTLQVKGDKTNGSEDLPASMTYVEKSGTTGTKTDTPITEVPQSISVVTSKEMEDRGVEEMEDALAYTSGVVTDQWGNDDRYQTFMIRGFDAGYQGMYVDGLFSGVVGDFTASRIDPYSIDRYEIFKGSTSTLYGLNKPGGMVNAVTKKPTTDPLHEVELSYGSNNTWVVKGDFGGALTEDGVWSYRLNTLYQDGETDRDFSERDRFLFAPSFTWAPNDKTSLTVQTSYYKVKDTPSDGIPEQIADSFDSDHFLGEPSADFFNTTQESVGYLFDYDFKNSLKFHSGGRFSRVDVDYESVYGSAYDTSTDTLDRAAFLLSGTSDTYTLDNNVQYDYNGGWFTSKALAGVDYRFTSGQESYLYGDATALTNVSTYGYTYAGNADILSSLSTQDRSVEQSALGLYVQDQFKVYDHWLLTLGGRQDWVNTTVRGQSDGTSLDDEYDDSAFTWRGGVSYLFDNGLAPYFSYSESFYPVATTMTTATGSKRADPTEGKQYEVGIKYTPDFVDGLFTVAGFDLTQTNVVSTDPTTYFSHQTGEVEVKGIEVEGRVNLFDGWSVIGSYTWQDPEITKSEDSSEIGERPDLVPAHMASGWVSYAFGPGTFAKGLTVGGGVRFVGNSASWNSDYEKQVYDGYTLYDAMVSYQVTDTIKWSLTGKNLADKDYYTTCYYGSCYAGDGRTVTTAIKMSW